MMYRRLAIRFERALSTGNSSLEHRGLQKAVSSHIIASTDEAYLESVENQEWDVLTSMVRATARRKGYKYPAFHGSYEFFHIFDKTQSYADQISKGRGIWFSANTEVSNTYNDTYTDCTGRIKAGIEYSVYLRMMKPFIIDCRGADWRQISTKRVPPRTVYNYLTHQYEEIQTFNSDHIANWADSKGYDGVIFKNMVDGALENKPDTIYCVFDSSQVKLSDLVTYDDSKSVIPLNQRFNKNTKDIRY